MGYDTVCKTCLQGKATSPPHPFPGRGGRGGEEQGQGGGGEHPLSVATDSSFHNEVLHAHLQRREQFIVAGAALVQLLHFVLPCVGIAVNDLHHKNIPHSATKWYSVYTTLHSQAVELDRPLYMFV